MFSRDRYCCALLLPSAFVAVAAVDRLAFPKIVFLDRCPTTPFCRDTYRAAKSYRTLCERTHLYDVCPVCAHAVSLSYCWLLVSV